MIANTISPPKRDDRITVPATMNRDLIKEIYLGEKVFKLEETTLPEIIKTLGQSEISHSGDAASSQYWLCYSLENSTIWFISHGEMGGLRHRLTQIYAVAENLGCPRLENKNIKSSFGWLGISKESLISILGEPSGVTSNVYKYFYSGEQPRDYQGEAVDFNVMGYAEFVFENNVVISVYASHVTSY